MTSTLLRYGAATTVLVGVLASSLVLTSGPAQAAVAPPPINWAEMTAKVSTETAAKTAGRVMLPRASMVLKKVPPIGPAGTAAKVLEIGIGAWQVYDMYHTWKADDEPEPEAESGGAKDNPPGSDCGFPGCVGLRSYGAVTFETMPKSTALGEGAFSLRFDFGASAGVDRWSMNGIRISVRMRCVGDSGYAQMSEKAWFYTKETDYPSHVVGIGDVCSQPSYGANGLQEVQVVATPGRVDQTGSLDSVTYASTPSWTPPEVRVPADEDFRYWSEVECKRADGSKFTLVGPKLLGRKDGNAGVVIPSCAEAEPGAANWDVKVVRGVDGSPSTLDLAEVGVNDDWMNAHPKCSAGGCRMDYAVDGDVCTVGASGCSTATLTQLRDRKSSRLSCRWGPYLITVNECVGLEVAYEPDPANPTPTTKPTASAPPIPTVSVPPEPDDPAVPKPRPEDNAENACWPTGWGVFNPASWVLKPIKCGLEWAFIPNPNSFHKFWSDNKAAFNRSAFGSWAGLSGAWVTAWGSVGVEVGCQGPPVDTGFLGQNRGGGDPFHVGSWQANLPQTIYPFEACEGVKATVAATSRMILTGVILFFGGWRCVRIVGRPFGYDLDGIDKGVIGK